MQELAHILESLGPPFGILYLLMAVGVTLAAFAVSVPRLLRRENHHFV